MKKFLRILVFLLLFTLVFSRCYRVLSWKDTLGAYLSTTEQLYATADNQMDVVFVGSSHCYCSMMPYMLWEEYGLAAFDMAISGQDRESSYYHVKEVLKTQNPQVICVDLGGLVYDGYEIEGNLYRNALSMKVSEINLDLIKAVVPEEDQMDFISRWPIIHTRYSELERYDFDINEYSEYGRGNGLPLGGMYVEIDPEILAYDGIGEIPEDKKEWLERFIALSEEEGFTLVFVNAPFQMDIAQRGMYNAVAEYLEEEGIVFFDYSADNSDLPIIDAASDFLDHGHMNLNGASKITEHIGEYLVSNFTFEDHRGDPAYAMWEQDASYCNQWIQETIVKYEQDWDTYVGYLLNSEDRTIVLSLEGDYESSTIDLYGKLESFELEDGYIDGGKWIIEGGQVIERIEGDDMEAHYYDLGEDVMRIQNVDADLNPGEALSYITIDGVDQGVTYNGLTILVYDKLLHKVIDVKAWY